MKTASSTSKRSSPRTQGRPNGKKSVGKAALVDAAIEVLKNTAPEALTIADVARRAGVNTALVHYYFEGKKGLLQEAAQTLVAREQAAAAATLSKGRSIEETLPMRLSGMIELVASNPHFHRLVMETVYGERGVPTTNALGEVGASGLKVTKSLLNSADKAKLRHIDPRFLHITMIGISEFFVAAQPLLKEYFDATLTEAELRKQYVAFVTDLFLNGMKKESVKPAKKR